MPIYQPSELHQFLKEQGLSPRKGLSQNFLIDGNILRKIVASAHVEADDWVVEIGPGPGALTEQLLNTGAHVIAIEKDAGMAKALSRLQQEGRLSIFCDDIMQFPLEETLKTHLPQGKKAKLIANLPYHLTTPILTQFVTQADHFSSLTVMVQDEVAKRFTAKSKTSAYGSITVFLNVYAAVHYAFRVSRNCFYPQPNVDSAIVTFTLHPPQQLEKTDDFFKITRRAFEQRRKMLKSSLSEMIEPQKIEAALHACELPLNTRPEELSLEQWTAFYHALNNTQKEC